MPDQPDPIPQDDPSRKLTIARPDEDQGLPHIGLVGDTYTILVTGQDMISPGGGGRTATLDPFVSGGSSQTPYEPPLS